MKKLKVGVIGLGCISYAHIPAYQNNPDAELHAICDKSENWLDYRAKQLKISHAYTNYKDLLKNPEIEAVSVCLPTKFHAQAAIDALNAGKHVLCEKPMAINAKEASAMCEAAQKNGKKLMISHNQRFDPDVQLMQKKMKEGFFGEIYFARIGWRRPLGILPEQDLVRENGEHYSRNWFNEKDNGGGVLRDLGSHLLDLTMYITDFPKLASADASCYRKFYVPGYDGSYACDSEDLATAHLKFETGLAIQMEVSFGSLIERETLFTEIYGTKGGASRRDGKLKLIRDKSGLCEVTEVEKYDLESKGPQARFVDAILNDTEVPVTPEQGLNVISILDEIYKSAGEIKNN
ncbi:MAG: Gfo/Idh/MocA family oxidoreductase [Oscillospiraceae bacterium]|nr:Gfo/Idh/MocA family oxidoreductase [Oscillospiraceae bacterium]